jgi:WD40 repeat protein
MLDALFSAAPYPGLRPFLAGESDIFFGREEQVDTLLGKLRAHHFVAVVGPSGCGKSSLVRAGMVSALESGFMEGAGHHWRVVDMRPGSNPMTRLVDALVAPGALGRELGAAESAFPVVLAHLRRGPLGLVEVLRDVRLPESANLLILVDQFEEIFRYRRLGDANAADAFVGLLLATAQCTELPVYVVITMRSDFLGDCAVFRGLAEAIGDSQFLTPRLTREQMASAIAGPARVFGGDVDPALVNRLINDVGPDPDQLPVLQHALMRMWGLATAAQSPREDPGTHPGAVLTLADYTGIGGLSEALSRHADEVFNALDPTRRRLAEVMFKCLTERSEGRRDTRRPASVHEVAEVAGCKADEVVAVADAFRAPGISLITPPSERRLREGTVLDISHESLIRLWSRLGTWVDEEDSVATVYRRLVQTALLWKNGAADPWVGRELERIVRWSERNRPTPGWARRYGSDAEFEAALKFVAVSARRDRDTRRRRTVLQAALVGCLVVVGVLGWVAWYLSREASLDIRSRELAFKSRDMRMVDADLALLTAMEAVCVKPTQGLDASLRSVLASRKEQVRFYAPDGIKVVTIGYLDGEPRVLGEGPGGRLALWDPVTRTSIKHLQAPPVQFQVQSAVFSPRSARVVVVGEGDDSSYLAVWDAHSGDLLDVAAVQDKPIKALAIDATGSRIALSAMTGRIWLARLDRGRLPEHLEEAVLRAPADPLLEFSHDGSRLLAVSRDPDAETDRIIVLEVSGGPPRLIAQIERERANRSFPWRGSISPDGRRLLTVDGDQAVDGEQGMILWDIAARRPIKQWTVKPGAPQMLRFLGDSTRAVLLTLEGSARVINLDEPDEVSVNDAGGSIYALDVSESADQAIALSTDKSVRVIRLGTGLTKQLPSEVFTAAFSPDGAQVALGTAQEMPYVVSNTGEVRRVPLDGADRLPSSFGASDRAQVTALAFGRGRGLLGIGYRDGRVRLWRAGGQAVAVPPGSHSGTVRCIDFARDDSRMVTASDDGSVKVWDTQDGEPGMVSLRASWPGAKKVVEERAVCAAFHMGSHEVSVVTSAGHVWHWNPEVKDATPTLIRKLRPGLTGVTIGDRGRVFLGVGYNRNSRAFAWVWGPAPEDPPRALAGQSIPLNFTEDGKRVATIDESGILNVWDVATGLPIAKFQAGAGGAISPRGDRVVGTKRNIVRLHDCPACSGAGGMYHTVADQTAAILDALLADSDQGGGLEYDCLQKDLRKRTITADPSRLVDPLAVSGR